MFVHIFLKKKSIPVLTNLFQESRIRRKKEITDSLKKIIEYLETIPDYTIEMFVKVGSFIPLIERLAPDDTIRICKRKR